MREHTGEALILRTYTLGEADRIVVFLTREWGKKRGVAKAARASRRRFGGALEPFTRVRVAFLERETRELVHLTRADVLSSPLAAATAEPQVLGHAAYFAELLDAWAPENDPNEPLFRLGSAVLEALIAGVPVDRVARYFEYWVLRLQGVYPPLTACPRCGGPLAARGAALDRGRLRFCCRDCLSGPQVPGLSPAALAFLREAGRVAPVTLASVWLDPAACRELQQVQGWLLSAHLEREPRSLRVLRDLGAWT